VQEGAEGAAGLHRQEHRQGLVEVVAAAVVADAEGVGRPVREPPPALVEPARALPEPPQAVLRVEPERQACQHAVASGRQLIALTQPDAQRAEARPPPRRRLRLRQPGVAVGPDDLEAAVIGELQAHAADIQAGSARALRGCRRRLGCQGLQRVPGPLRREGALRQP